MFLIDYKLVLVLLLLEEQRKKERNRCEQKQTKVNKNKWKLTNKPQKYTITKQNQAKKKPNKQNFFFVPHSWQDQKNIFLFFTQPKTYHLSHFIYILDNFSLMSFNTANLKVTMPQDKQ